MARSSAEAEEFIVFETIDQQRRFAARLVIGGVWLLAPVIAIASALSGGAWLALGLAGVGVASAATIVWRTAGASLTTRMVSGVSLMASISLLVAALSGHAWQIDMHMAYFAALAVLIVYCDWRVIAAATAVVAGHHLLVSYVLPAAVFPGGGDVERVLVHAVILLIEAGVLIWVGANLARMFARSEEMLSAASQARERAEGATADAQAARAGEAQAASERESVQRGTEAEARQVVGALAKALGALAVGDVTHRIGETFPEQYGQLKRDFNAAAEQLQSTLASIVGVNGRVRSSVGEIASASMHLSQRTENQAATLEETAAALDEITATVRRTAVGARQAREVVGAARAHAQDSGVVVESAVSAMTNIEESSRQIGQIVGVIDEIAFQTNLLALNAGVEAARAGEAGRGFAVVASEVRALAQRSAEAAKEIKVLISTSTGQVADGVRLVGQTGEVLNRIVTEVSAVNEAIAEIALSAEEQASSLQQVNTAMNALDGVTQQNAAMVEEATAATQTLSGDTERMTQLVSHFQVGDAAPARRAA
jgi:methyl-accepting chemotaxis protein